MIIQDANLLATMAAVNATVNADSAFNDNSDGLYRRRTLGVAGQQVEFLELMAPGLIDWTAQRAAEKRRRLVAAGYGPAGLLIALVAIGDGTHRPVLTADVSAPDAPATYVLDSTSDEVLAWDAVSGIQFRESADDETWALVGGASAN